MMLNFKLGVFFIALSIPNISSASPDDLPEVYEKPSQWKNKVSIWRERIFDSRPEAQYYHYETKRDKEERPVLNSEMKASESVGQVQEVRSLETAKNQLIGAIHQQPLNSYSQTVRDEISAYWFSKKLAISAERTVFLALGNKMNPLSPEVASKVSELARGIYEKGSRVLYDADSQAASLIREAVPRGYRLGISGLWEAMSDDVLVISNPYIRMNQLLTIESIVISPDSVLGLGLLIEGYGNFKNKFSVFDPLNQWPKHGLSNWSSSVAESPVNLGISYPTYKEPKTYSSVEDLIKSIFYFSYSHFSSSFGASLKKIPQVEYLDFLNQFESKDIFEIHERAESYSRKSNILTLHPKTGQRIPGGAVLFGSGSGSYHYEPLVQAAVRKLAKESNPIVTGGAGGFMQTANRVACQEGALSIGIPLGGSHRIFSELFTADGDHDLTLAVPGYEFRIPLLLQDRKFILVAPGGSGTMKELAVTLVKFATELGSNDSADIFFLSGAYYGSLFGWLEKLPLPASFRKKVFLYNPKIKLQRT